MNEAPVGSIGHFNAVPYDRNWYQRLFDADVCVSAGRFLDWPCTQLKVRGEVVANCTKNHYPTKRAYGNNP